MVGIKIEYPIIGLRASAKLISEAGNYGCIYSYEKNSLRIGSHERVPSGRICDNAFKQRYSDGLSGRSALL